MYIHRPFSDTAAVFVGCLQYIWSFSGKDSLFLYILFWNNECEPKNIVWSMILLSKMFTEKSVVHWNWVRTKECKLRQITVAIFIAKIPWNQRISYYFCTLWCFHELCFLVSKFFGFHNVTITEFYCHVTYFLQKIRENNFLSFWIEKSFWTPTCPSISFQFQPFVNTLLIRSVKIYLHIFAKSFLTQNSWMQGSKM